MRIIDTPAELAAPELDRITRLLGFSEEGHTYIMNGVELRSVTTILKLAGMYPDFHNGSRAAEFGTNFHKATALSDRDDLAECDPVMAPWMESWEQWVDTQHGNGWSMLGDFIEQPLCDDRLGVAGTPDRVLIRQTRSKLHKWELWLVDLKTGIRSPVWDLQLAAYAHLVSIVLKVKPDRIIRSGLRVTENAVEEHSPSRPHAMDWMTFLSCVNTVKWRAAHNLI